MVSASVVQQAQQHATKLVDSLAYTGVFAAIMGWLGPIMTVVAATLSSTWILIQIIQAVTGKKFSVWLKEKFGAKNGTSE